MGELLKGGVDPLLRPSGDHHLRFLRGEPSRDGEPDTCRRPTDERLLPCEPKIHLYLLAED
jgi:hypothetical protein